MSIKFKDNSGVTRTLVGNKVCGPDGVVRTIKTRKVMGPDGVLRVVYSSTFPVTIAPAYLSGDMYDDYAEASGAAATGLVTAGPYTATPGGGTAPYSYSWAFVGVGSGLTINTPTAASTTISGTFGGLRSVAVRCTVTDANGIIVASPILNVELQWVDTR